MIKRYFRPLMLIAVPIMLSNIISQVQMIIDRMFLGQMNKLYMSALGNVNSPMWTTASFCFSITVGASILISQGVGAGQKEKIESYASSMIKWNNIVPVLLFFFWFFCGEYVYRAMGVSDNLMPMCLEYTRYFSPIFLLIGLEGSFTVILQTSNYTKPLVYFGLSRSLLNVLLDWILIFGKFGFPEMGIKGAAIATTISEYAGFIISLALVIKNPRLKTMPSFSAIVSAKLKPFLRSVRLGINTALEDTAWNLGNLALIRILNSIDEMAAGIYSIVFSIEILVVVVIGTIGNGTLTLSGEAKGKGEIRQIKGVCMTAYILSVLVAFATLIVCLIFPHQILGLFTNEKEIITSCGLYLILVCLNFYGKAGNIIIGNGIRGSGNTIWMLMTQIFGTFMVIGFGMLFVYGFGMGITGVFVAVIADELIRAVINLFKFRSILKKWEQNKPQSA